MEEPEKKEEIEQESVEIKEPVDDKELINEE